MEIAKLSVAYPFGRPEHGDGQPHINLPDHSGDPSFLLLHEIRRIADSHERVAEGIEMIAKQAHLLSPPMTVELVAEQAGVKPKTIYRWHSEGLLDALADDVRPLLFDRGVVADFLTRRRRGK
jgi:hypothetical protein